VIGLGMSNYLTPQPTRGAEAKSPIGATGGAGRSTSFVSVMTQVGGSPVVSVRYPWKTHARPSIEVCAIEDGQDDEAMIQPLYFAHDMMKGEITKAVYACQDRAAGVAQKATFSVDDIDFRVFGSRNLLGRPSVCVACRTKPDPTQRETRARAVFCLLDAWATDTRTLYLELPEEYFSESTRIRLWLLRKGDVVWSETVAWPGFPQSESAKPPADAPPADAPPDKPPAPPEP
jgi:hypothetical protein